MRFSVRRRGYHALLVLLGAIALFVVPTWPPQALGGANGFLLSVSGQAAVFAIVALATGMFVNLTGLPSLAQAGLWGIGAYAAGVAAAELGIGFWPSLLAAAAIPALVALPIGFVALRTRGIAFLIVTLAFSGFVVLLLENLSITGGSTGLVVSESPGSLGPLSFGDDRSLYYLLLAFLALAMVVYWLVGRSHFGRSLRAIRDNESLARSLGLSALWTRLLLLSLSGAIVGVAGALLLYQQRAVTPDLFDGLAFIDVYLAIVLGGTALIVGPAVGAWIVLFLPVWLGSSDPNTSRLIYGVLLVLAILLIPDGIFGTLRKWAFRRAPPAVEGRPDAAQPPSPSAPTPPPSSTPARTAPSEEVVLEVEDLKRWFGANHALDGVDLSIRRAEIRGIIGPNGSGKTTLLNCVSGFMPLTGGTIRFRGERIDGHSPDRIAREGVVRTFQQPETFGTLTVGESCELILESARRHARAGSPGELVDILSACRLADCADLPVTELSYGQLRLLGVAMALSCGPEVIMLDEPLAGLTPAEGALLRESIEAARDEGVTVAVVDHDMTLMLTMCDRLTVLDSGIKLAEGDPTTVAQDKAVIAAYLGERFAARNPDPSRGPGSPG